MNPAGTSLGTPPPGHDGVALPAGFEGMQAADTSPSGSWLFTQLPGSRWLGRRLRLLVAGALLGCVGLFLLATTIAAMPQIDARWRADATGRIELASSDDPALAPFVGHALTGVSAAQGRLVMVDALLLQRSPRWLSSDAERSRHRTLHVQLHAVLAQAPLRLHFAEGASVEVRPSPRNLQQLGLLYWLVSALALLLYLITLSVILARPSARNLLFAAMALSQCGNLVFIGASTAFDLAMPPDYVRWELHARTLFDLVTAAAIVHAVVLHPRRLPHAAAIAAGGWLVAGLLAGLQLAQALPNAWWWTQAGGAALGLAAVALLGWSYRIEPHPFAVVLRRFGIVTVGTWILLTAAVAVTPETTGMPRDIAGIGSMIWVVFLASLMLMVPFLARSQHMLREFSLLAGISTVATSLDLLFVAVFSFGQFTSVTLSVFLSIGLYVGARQWVLNHLRGRGMVTMERLFERLYRMAREVEAHPERAPAALLSLLRELFEPLEASVLARASEAAHASGEGSTLLVPVPDLRRAHARADQTLVLRFAQRGQRLFSDDDARLADRIVEQLKRAVVFDQAVERGRSEERSRIAQDLHDDIGARLLTLMYQAQNSEQEDYIRHTLQDLKTLTRGLAAQNHRLSHAAAEWKADAQQRLELAGVALDWTTRFEPDPELSVVQWSALTRVLRELVSNAITHAQATRLAVGLELSDDSLTITVTDDGCGSNPQAWAHGLGLGGVRKRVKQLGGEVVWQESPPSGIRCTARFAHWPGAGT